MKRPYPEPFPCAECGQMVMVKEVHMLEDCLNFQRKTAQEGIGAMNSSSRITTPWDAEVVRLKALNAPSLDERVTLVQLLGCIQGYFRAKREALEKSLEEME